MPRRKLSEYRAKQLLTETLGGSHVGWEVYADSGAFDTAAVSGYDRYVVKVDQAVKGRFKKGLVVLDVAPAEVKKEIKRLHQLGYSSFLVEPYASHPPGSERYVSITYDRAGTYLHWSSQGGVDIESQAASVQSVRLDEATDWSNLSTQTGISEVALKKLTDVFYENYFVLLEINPYVVQDGRILLLDAAVEVDDAGAFFTHLWSEADFRFPMARLASTEEAAVRALDAGSSASFNLSILHPDGAVFLLLSGGGASVVVADEIFNSGYGRELANYGEYSGNPTQDETAAYTGAVLSLLLASSAPKKVLFIGGAVANFTDIATTFGGVIAAIDDVAERLRRQNVKVYVRRGGPRQEIGLAKLEACLQHHGILGEVHSAETALTEVVARALQELA